MSNQSSWQVSGHDRVQQTLDPLIRDTRGVNLLRSLMVLITATGLPAAGWSFYHHLLGVLRTCCSCCWSSCGNWHKGMATVRSSLYPPLPMLSADIRQSQQQQSSGRA